MADDPRYKWDAFISYTRKRPDVWLAQQAYEALTSEGLRVWMDRAKIGVGDDFHEKIVTNLELSRTVVCIITPASLGSDWCKAEWFYGRATAHVLPVVKDLEFDKLPFGINSSEALRLSPSWSAEQLVLLARKLRFLSLMNPPARERLANPNTTAKLLEQAIEWPPSPLLSSRSKSIQRIKDAESVLLALPHTEASVRDYNNPDKCLMALAAIRDALTRTAGAPEAWRAFAALAAPFNRHYQRIGLKNAKVSVAEFRAETGTTPQDEAAAYFASLESIRQHEAEYDATYRPVVDAAIRLLDEDRNPVSQHSRSQEGGAMKAPRTPNPLGSLLSANPRANEGRSDQTQPGPASPKVWWVVPLFALLAGLHVWLLANKDSRHLGGSNDQGSTASSISDGAIGSAN